MLVGPYKIISSSSSCSRNGRTQVHCSPLILFYYTPARARLSKAHNQWTSIPKQQ
ncbi:hypothetical protein SISSUDRAFT_221769 [Sistotremastrum suecicum HHB10207 ss-3]|uniref:Uncharacterized protein n=1 Tax=Sistotremastrum suecicum HHB10207 ss-3 TaxID=1314776 RepID=A0A166A3Y1_9AGAM|nr:hypothetical protein SISSUDRAFT_221769 [Sistotremastrum suecicum HHB10207 ss-3]